MVDKLKNNPKVMALLGVAAVVLIVGLAITYWPTSPPAMPETMDDVKALLAADKYAKLSKAQKQPYQERAREIMSSADGEARRDLAAESAEMELDHFASRGSGNVLDVATELVGALDVPGKIAVGSGVIEAGEGVVEAGQSPADFFEE